MPLPLPILGNLLNRVVPAIPLLNTLCLVRITVARPQPTPRDAQDVSVSVIVPCKNEFGNIEPAVQRIPDMGKHTEIIFCDDKSTDGTADEVQRMQQVYADRDIKLLYGPGISKSHNVWTGFDGAQGDVLMILDADLAVMPEELPAFFEAIVSGKAELVNGTRLVYPLPRASMKFTNHIGNTVFGILFSYLLDQPISDTLCGTKVIWRADWQRLKTYLNTWGVEDRWGDYEILFGGARLHLKIVELPVHYQERIYGASKMTKVVKNGTIMLQMCVRAFIHFKLRLHTSATQTVPPASAPQIQLNDD
jgi:glycosyltransferase involved in cell wall biosynthesis